MHLYEEVSSIHLPFLGETFYQITCRPQFRKHERRRQRWPPGLVLTCAAEGRIMCICYFCHGMVHLEALLGGNVLRRGAWRASKARTPRTRFSAFVQIGTRNVESGCGFFSPHVVYWLMEDLHSWHHQPKVPLRYQLSEGSFPPTSTTFVLVIIWADLISTQATI